MSKRAHDIFALIIKFLAIDRQPKHVTFGVFKVTNNTKQILAINLIEMLGKCGLKKKIVTYARMKSLIKINCKF
jgi:hypothetical protein